MPKKSFKPQKTGVSFHPVVLKFLDTLVVEEEPPEANCHAGREVLRGAARKAP
jgi:uncharacterized DUF497 family protein